MIAHALYTGAPWEVLYRVHGVMRGPAARQGGHNVRTDDGPGIVAEVVVARSVRTGQVATFLPESLGLDPTPTPDRAEVLASIGMDQQLKAEKARYGEPEMPCGRTCDVCPAAAICHEGYDEDTPDIDMAEVALQLETGTAYLTDLT